MPKGTPSTASWTQLALSGVMGRFRTVTAKSEATAVGPGRMVAGQAYQPGVHSGQVYRPGAQQGQVYLPGFTAGQV